MDAFFREVGGNPYQHDEYEVCAELKEAADKKEWYKIDECLRKPQFGFIELEIVKALKKWVMDRPSEDDPEKMMGQTEKDKLDEMLC
jgi:hypothetical protein